MREVHTTIDGVTVLVGTFPESQVAAAHQRLKAEFGTGVTLEAIRSLIQQEVVGLPAILATSVGLGGEAERVF